MAFALALTLAIAFAQVLALATQLLAELQSSCRDGTALAVTAEAEGTAAAAVPVSAAAAHPGPTRKGARRCRPRRRGGRARSCLRRRSPAAAVSQVRCRRYDVAGVAGRRPRGGAAAPCLRPWAAVIELASERAASLPPSLPASLAAGRPGGGHHQRQQEGLPRRPLRAQRRAHLGGAAGGYIHD